MTRVWGAAEVVDESSMVRTRSMPTPSEDITSTEDWSSLPPELLLKVLRDGLGWEREASRAVRLVSHSWKEVHDTNCVTVRIPWDVTDERLQLVCTRFPALSSLDLSCADAYSETPSNVTSKGLSAVSNLPALKALNLSGCKVTSKGLRAVSNIRSLTYLNLRACSKVTDKGLRAVTALTALTTLDLIGVNQCREYPSVSFKEGAGSKVTEAGMQVLRNALPQLRISEGHEGSEDSYTEVGSDLLGFTSDSDTDVWMDDGW
jgi:hypothetical protein